MKLLIVGSDKKFAIEKYFLQYFEGANVKVALYPAQRMFHDYYYQSIKNKIKYRLGFSKIIKIINRDLLELVSTYEPNILFVFKGMEILPATLKKLSIKNIILANYNPDNPFIFSGKGSGNKNVINGLNLFDIHFTYSVTIKKELEKKTKSKIYLLPFAYAIDNNLFPSIHCQNEVIKTCFIGNPDKERVSFIKQLADFGIELDLYGHNWNKYINHDKVKIYEPVYENEFWKTLYKYRVQLNIMRKHNLDSHNMRSFEIPGVGGIGLFPETYEHLNFFEKDKEVFMYTSLENCVKKIKYLISLENNVAKKIRKAAANRSVNSKYTYQDRAKFVLDVFKNIG